MNQRDFISLIKEPANNRAEDLDQLEKVADTFPYCQVAHILIAKISNDHSMMLADQKLKKASAYIANRPKLRRLINGQTNEITVEQLIQKFPKAVEETPKTKKTTTTEKTETPKAPITTKSKTETKQPVNNEDKENPYVNNDLISEVQATLAALKEETAKPTPKAKVKKAPVKTTAAKKKTTTKKTAATTKAKRSVTTSKKTTPTKKVTAATKKKATTKTAPAKKTISKKAAGKKKATTKSSSTTTKSSSTTTKKTAPKKKPAATKKASPKAKTAKSVASKKKATPPKKTIKKTTTAAKKTTTAKKMASSTPKKKTVTKKKAASTSKKTGSTTKTRKKSTASTAKTKKPTRKSTARKSTSPSKKKPVNNKNTSTTKSYFEKEGVYNETDLLLDYLNSITSTSGADQKQLQEEILEKFIKENPSISPLKGAKKPKKKGDLSKKSVKADNELVSENLAKIFIKQNKLSKAVDIYKKLILKYPKKKAYFTTQIQKLKDK